MKVFAGKGTSGQQLTLKQFRVNNKKFFVLFLPFFHKLQTIQKKIKSKNFISAVARSSDSLYLTKNKGCSQFGQPNLFVLTVGDRLPGVGWANSSLSRTSRQRLGQGGLGWQPGATAQSKNLNTEHLGGGRKLMMSGGWDRRRCKPGLCAHLTRTKPVPSCSKAQRRRSSGKRRGRDRGKRGQPLIPSIVTLLINKCVFNP